MIELYKLSLSFYVRVRETLLWMGRAKSIPKFATRKILTLYAVKLQASKKEVSFLHTTNSQVILNATFCDFYSKFLDFIQILFQDYLTKQRPSLVLMELHQDLCSSSVPTPIPAQSCALMPRLELNLKMKISFVHFCFVFIDLYVLHC